MNSEVSMADLWRVSVGLNQKGPGLWESGNTLDDPSIIVSFTDRKNCNFSLTDGVYFESNYFLLFREKGKGDTRAFLPGLALCGVK